MAIQLPKKVKNKWVESVLIIDKKKRQKSISSPLGTLGTTISNRSMEQKSGTKWNERALF